ncbi:MAG: thioredoxin family protein [Candidatus Cloacimonadaceae bacterium]|nr:thioredoxin family protein [Candidatus Cloacimonadaceae bacterium]
MKKRCLPNQSGTWITDWDQALAASKELGRPVLIDFTGSDWCGWCIKLKGEVFSKPAFIEYAKDNLILLMIDFPRKRKLPVEQQTANQKLAEKFEVEGFPTIVLVNENGKEIKRTGYQPGGPEKYIDHIKSLLPK